MTDFYYSTQTTLADRIARDFYAQYYIYVAVEMDPLKNDPTSNPRVLRDWWCKISLGETIDTGGGNDFWFDHRQKLKQVAWFKALNGEIPDSVKLNIQKWVDSAERTDAAPLMYVIPKANIGPSRLRAGDSKGEKYPDNIEYIIADLRDADRFTKNPVPCAGEPDLETRLELGQE